MKAKRNESKLRVFINQLMQGKSENEIIEAEERFTAYLRLIRDIQQRIESEKE